MADTIKKPVEKGVARVPVVMQMEALECGAACLCMVCAYYNKWIPLEQVRVDCGVSRDGSNARNVLRAALSYGLDGAGYRFERAEDLRENGTFPCVIHWNFNHFVVLCGFRGKYAYINDPARGNVRLTIPEFDEAFTGVCLLFEPTERFVPDGARKSTLSFARKRLAGAGAAVFVMLTGVIAYMFGMIHPVFSVFFMDRLLTGENRELLIPFVLLLALVGALEILIEALREIYSLKINGKMAVIGNSTYIWKVLRLPMEFFSQRMAGDILSRQSANAAIAQTLIQTLAPLLLDAAMMVFYLLVMLRQSPLLTLVGLVSVVVNLSVMRVISRKRVNITRVQMRDMGKLNAATVSGIQMAETIKASGAESGFFRKWSGYQASVNAQNTRYAEIDLYLGVIPAFISAVSNSVVLVLGLWLTMRGSFTLGAITAFQAYLGLFMTPAMTMISAGQSIQEMRTQMERIEDVMEYPEDSAFSEPPAAEENCQKLSGEVELRNVTFGYSRLGDALIEDFSMHLRPGQRVAFVGASGCGKSTLAKLISGLYHPWDGEILFDGKPISEIDRSVFTGSLAVVDQDIILFEDSISQNIRMWDNTIQDFEVILAARDAQIYDDIMKRAGGFDGRLAEGGRDLSGGQRQRLEIARVLAQDPSIIIMDEATSALDAKTEYELVKAVKDRGITCIVIAHRLSTVRDCDEIIVLDHGAVAERGTHEELYARGGVYKDLISND